MRLIALPLFFAAQLFLLPAIIAQTKPAAAAKDVVAIYPFTTARSYSYDYAVGAGNAVEAGVLRSGRFTVVERSRFGSVSEEERFTEANTSDIVRKASKLGAKTIITGHIAGVSHGPLVNGSGVSAGREYAEISLSFKIIDVNSGEIRMSEIIIGRGEGTTSTEAMQGAYQNIDKILRGNVAAYLPQRFKFMSVVSTGSKKDVAYLDKFKIWAGADDGLKAEDVLEIYQITTLVNPNTNKPVEEKTLLAQARVAEVNGGSSSTCQVIDGKRKGAAVLAQINAEPARVVFEYKGNFHVRMTWGDMLKAR